MHGTTIRSFGCAAFIALWVAACGDSGDDRADWVAGRKTPCPVFTRAGECRPAKPKDLIGIAGGALLLPAAGVPVAGGGFVAFAVRWSDARLVSAATADAATFEAATTLPWNDARGAASAAVGGGRELVYVLARAGAGDGLFVSTLHGADLDPPVPVALEGSTTFPTWPHAVALADGRVLLTFVDPQTSVLVGVDDGSGRRFQMRALSLPQTDLQGVIAHVGTTASGAWLVTYQAADAAWRFRSYVTISRDEGASWSAPLPVAGDEDSAYAIPIARAEDGADVYYTSSAEADEGGLLPEKRTVQAVRRRHLHEDGTLGPEQMVTAPEVGDVRMPLPFRLADGRLALMVALDPNTSSARLAMTTLDGDCP